MIALVIGTIINPPINTPMKSAIAINGVTKKSKYKSKTATNLQTML